MSLESAITKMRDRNGLTPVTSKGQLQVNEKTASDQQIDPVDPVDPGRSLTRNPDPATRERVASNQGDDLQRVWFIQACGKTFRMIRPGGMNRAQAEEAARARWPDARVMANEPRYKGNDDAL